MLRTMPSARRPCSTIFFRFPVSIPIVSTISARLLKCGGSIVWAADSLSSANSSTERSAKLLTKLSGFLISCAMPGGQLPQRRHLLRMDQACLRRLQFAQCLLGGVPGCANGFLGTLALRDVGKDQYEATARHRIASYLDDTAVGSRSLETQLPACIAYRAAQLRFEISRILAAISEIA